MALAQCILGKFLGVGCHCFPPPLDIPTFSARCLHVQRRERPPAAEGRTLRGREMSRQISSRIRLPCNSRDLLHAANLRHGTDGFTSPPKEGVLRSFFALKNPMASAGFEPANLDTKGQHATSRPSKLFRVKKIQYKIILICCWHNWCGQTATFQSFFKKKSQFWNKKSSFLCLRYAWIH
jgi:hypothetical protein